MEAMTAQRNAMYQIEKREREQETEGGAGVAHLFGGMPFNRARARRR